jgi:hypothetical protein
MSSSSSSSSSRSTSSFLASLRGKEEIPPADGGPADVVFASELDVLVFRFGHLLTTASDSTIIFSVKRYGYVTGQLPSTQDNTASPTTEENLEDRIFVCFHKGSYCIERALVFLRTSKQLASITMHQILRHQRLLSEFVSLCIAVHTLVRYNLGQRVYKKPLVNALDVQCSQSLANMIVYVANEAVPPALASDDIPAGTLQPFHFVTLSGDFIATNEEANHYRSMYDRPLAPLHRLLRLCMDATATKEDDFLAKSTLSAQLFVWDVNTDTPPEALAFQLTGKLLQILLECVTTIQNINQAVFRSKTRALVDSFSNADSAMKWILESKTRIVLFADLVASELCVKNGLLKTTSLTVEMLNRLRANSTTLISYFAKQMSPKFDCVAWQDTLRPKRRYF